jgi:hypothetical protein
LNQALDGSAQSAFIQSKAGGQILQIQFTGFSDFQNRMALRQSDAAAERFAFGLQPHGAFYFSKFRTKKLDRFGFHIVSSAKSCNMQLLYQATYLSNAFYSKYSISVY